MSKKKRKSVPVNMGQKDTLFCGTISGSEIHKQAKLRSSDYQLPRGGYFMTEKDRPRKRFKPKDYV
jgi:hypothetical protein